MIEFFLFISSFFSGVEGKVSPEAEAEANKGVVEVMDGGGVVILPPQKKAKIRSTSVYQ